MRSRPTTIELAGRTVSRIGLGTNRLMDSEGSRAFLRAAINAGIGHIDTAHLYTGGSSQATVGAAFGDQPERPLVATKGGYDTNRPKTLRAQLERSFELLRTDVIDLYYLHRVDPSHPLRDTISLLAEYVDAGRITAIGLSEVSVDEIRAAREIVPISAVQNEYSLVERMHEDVIDYCEAEGIAFMPFYPLRGEPRCLSDIASRHGVTRTQVKIAWLLERSPVMVPIPGTLSIEHVRENVGALDLELDEEEVERLTASGLVD